MPRAITLLQLDSCYRRLESGPILGYLNPKHQLLLFFCMRCGAVALLEVGSRAKTPKTQTSEGHGERRWGDIHMGKTLKRREKVPRDVKRTHGRHISVPPECTEPLPAPNPHRCWGMLSPAHTTICPHYGARGLPETLEGATGAGSSEVTCQSPTAEVTSIPLFPTAASSVGQDTPCNQHQDLDQDVAHLDDADPLAVRASQAAP